MRSSRDCVWASNFWARSPPARIASAAWWTSLSAVDQSRGSLLVSFAGQLRRIRLSLGADGGEDMTQAVCRPILEARHLGIGLLIRPASALRSLLHPPVSGTLVARAVRRVGSRPRAGTR